MGFSDTEMSGDGEFDKLELRNRTVTETLSPVEDLGQDKKETAEENGKETNKENGDDKVNGEDEKYDKLELRNRTVTETLSLVKDLGQDKKEEEETEQSQRQCLLCLTLARTRRRRKRRSQLLRSR